MVPKNPLNGAKKNSFWVFDLAIEYNPLSTTSYNAWRKIADYFQHGHPKETINAIMDLNQVCEILSRNSREWLWHCMTSCVGRLDAPSKHLLTISDRSWYADMSCQLLSRWFSHHNCYMSLTSPPSHTKQENVKHENACTTLFVRQQCRCKTSSLRPDYPWGSLWGKLDILGTFILAHLATMIHSLVY